MARRPRLPVAAHPGACGSDGIVGPATGGVGTVGLGSVGVLGSQQRPRGVEIEQCSYPLVRGCSMRPSPTMTNIHMT